MIRKQYQISIHATPEKVYRFMLGLDDKQSYNDWASAFNPTSTFEGSWEQGGKIYFVGTDENGQKAGMISTITEHVPSQMVSIKHYGFLKGEEEIVSGEEVEKWAGGMEIYRFIQENDSTKLVVDMDIVDEYLSYFDESYPKALQLLKSGVENQ